jgi:hypothetical protein
VLPTGLVDTTFMTNIGNYLKEHHAFGYCTDNYPGTSRKTTFWYLK